MPPHALCRRRARSRSPAKPYSIPLTGANHFVSVTDKEMTVTRAEVMVKIPGLIVKTAVDYRTQIIRELFDQMLGNRLGELSRQADPPFVRGTAEIGGFIDGLDVFDASVIAKPGEAEKGLKAVWREVMRVRRFGSQG